jgi:hypothetical protein
MGASLPRGERKEERRVIQLTIERMATEAYNISGQCQFNFLDEKKSFWTRRIIGVSLNISDGQKFFAKLPAAHGRVRAAPGVRLTA